MPSQDTVESPSRWSQFSLGSLMIAVTVFCVACAFVTFPPLLAMVCGIGYVLFTGVLAITVWKGRGWVQAFSVGAIVPHAAGLFIIVSSSEPVEFVAACVVLALVSLIAGIGSAAYQGFLVRRNGLLPVPNLPLIRTWFSNEPVQGQ